MKAFIHLLLGLGLSTALFAQEEVEIDVYPPSQIPDRIMLTWETEPHNSQSVTWRTSTVVEKAYAQICVATATPDLADRAFVYKASSTKLVSDQNIALYHSVNFTELLPNTTYAYRVGDSAVWSEWLHFTTASEEQAPFSFIYFGDAQNDLKSRWSRTIRGAYSKMPDADFLLHAGDLVNRPNSDHEWGEWFYAGGWIYGMMPSIATPGNHEYERGANRTRILSRHWRPTFRFPQNGPKGLGMEETVFYMDYQGTRIISLNSTIFSFNKEIAEAQVQWLIPLLENNPNDWTIVTMHYPVYSSKFGRDNPKLRKVLQPIFETYGVDLVLQGHDHTYGRGGENIPTGTKVQEIEGPVYVVSVSGPKMYDLSMEDWMRRGASNTQLYQLIHVSADTLRFEAYTTVDELYDAFELYKLPNGKTQYLDMTPADVPELLELPPRYSEDFSETQLDLFQERYKAYMKKKEKAEEKREAREERPDDRK
ncbi:MAG: metallophosphoesterase family protein [Bacteroidota bacterium]